MAARAARPPAIDGDLGDAAWEATPWTEEFVDIEGDARPGQAAVILNQKIYGLFNVRCSTKRKKADQSPYESIESGLATCSGLAVLLIDACRAVGVPARCCGMPLRHGHCSSRRMPPWCVRRARRR